MFIHPEGLIHSVHLTVTEIFNSNELGELIEQLDRPSTQLEIKMCICLLNKYRNIFLPAQNMLSVILTEVELRQMFWSTIGRWICCRTVGKFLTAGFQLSFRFPQPVTRPLKPSDIRLLGKK